MEFLNMLIDPLKFRLTCFLCLKQKEENLSVTQKLFICDEYQSLETTLAGVMNFLFPCHDIISSQACEDCSNILITTYTKLRRHNILRKTLSSITGALTDEVSRINLSSIEVDKIQMYLKMPIISKDDQENVVNDTKWTENEICITNTEDCSKCDMKFNSKELLFNHKTLAHKNIDQAAVCEFCGKDCKKPSTLKNHLNCHRVKTCPFCSKTLKSHSHYQIHLKNHTTKVKPSRKCYYYFCNLCSYRSLNKNSLEAHVNKVHLQVRPFICEICDKAFYRKSNLTEHVLIHDKIKSLTCEQCGDHFVTKKTLIEHLRLHSGEKPFECEICNERFVNSGRRSDHFKRKHMEKTISCFLCDKKFSLRKELNTHMKKIHGHTGSSKIQLIDTNNVIEHYFDGTVLVPNSSGSVI